MPLEQSFWTASNIVNLAIGLISLGVSIATLVKAGKIQHAYRWLLEAPQLVNQIKESIESLASYSTYFADNKVPIHEELGKCYEDLESLCELSNRRKRIKIKQVQKEINLFTDKSGEVTEEDLKKIRLLLPRVVRSFENHFMQTRSANELR